MTCFHYHDLPTVYSLNTNIWNIFIICLFIRQLLLFEHITASNIWAYKTHYSVLSKYHIYLYSVLGLLQYAVDYKHLQYISGGQQVFCPTPGSPGKIFWHGHPFVLHIHLTYIQTIHT